MKQATPTTSASGSLLLFEKKKKAPAPSNVFAKHARSPAVSQSETNQQNLPGHGHSHKDVLVERVNHELGHSTVVLAAVEQHQLLQESKLGDREVAGVDRLHPLLPADANADVGALDHGDVVGSVSDGQGPRLRLDFSN